MEEQFISEPLKPVTDSVDQRSFAIGAPLLPTEFLWRNRTLVVSHVCEQWKDTGPCRHGSGELYVRKHWFRLQLNTGEEIKVYFQRQPRSSGREKSRWWLFSMKSSR